MSDQVLVKMENIDKSFFGNKVNDSINFELKSGEIHALLGENGAGKTTLMNILTGVYSKDAGEIFFKKEEIHFRFPGEALKMGIGMVHQRFSLVERLSVLENIILGLPDTKFVINRKKRKKEIQELAKKYNLEVNLDTIVENLPIGLKQKVEILKMLVRDVDVLIVDEPTTVLTKQETDNLLKILRNISNSGKGIIIITHKMKTVLNVADRISVLRNGVKIETVIKKESTTARELAKMMVGKDVEMVKRENYENKNEDLVKIENLHVHSDKNILAVDSLSFNIKKGEIFGIAGVSGNGQLELCEALSGNRQIRDGKIWLKDRVISGFSVLECIKEGISYIPSDRINIGVAGKNKIWENIGLKIFRDKNFLIKKFFLNNKKMKDYATKIIEKYDVMQPGIDLPALMLSGGNLQKIIIGREIESDSDLYICSYPTRGLDVGAMNFVRESLIKLKKKGKSVLLISGDLDELFSLSDRIGVMYEGDFMGILQPKNYDVANIGLMMSGHSKEEVFASENEKKEVN